MPSFRYLSEASKHYHSGGARQLASATLGLIHRRLWSSSVVTRNIQIASLASDITEFQRAIYYCANYQDMSELNIPEAISKAEGRYYSSPRNIGKFSDAMVLGENPVVKVGATFFTPLSFGTKKHTPASDMRDFIENSGIPRIFPNERSTIACSQSYQSGFLLAGPRRNGVGNWFDEVLPKLRAFEYYRKITNDEPQIIVPSKLASFQRDSLNLLGYPPDTWIQYTGDPIQFDELIIPTHRYRSATQFSPAPTDMQWVQQKLLSGNSPSDGNSPDRIFVSRADAKRRNIVNEKEVQQVLEEYNFISIEPGRYSLSEQINLFNNAEYIIGPHGAGLVDILFAEDAHVIELLGDGPNFHYFILASELGHQYEAIKCSTIESTSKPRYYDIRVDISKLRDVVESAIIC